MPPAAASATPVGLRHPGMLFVLVDTNPHRHTSHQKAWRDLIRLYSPSRAPGSMALRPRLDSPAVQGMDGHGAERPMHQRNPSHPVNVGASPAEVSLATQLTHLPHQYQWYPFPPHLPSHLLFPPPALTPVPIHLSAAPTITGSWATASQADSLPTLKPLQFILYTAVRELASKSI